MKREFVIHYVVSSSLSEDELCKIIIDGIDVATACIDHPDVVKIESVNIHGYKGYPRYYYLFRKIKAWFG